MMDFRVLLLAVVVLVATSSARVYETADSIVVEAEELPKGRQQRQFFLPNVQERKEMCWDRQGRLGTCVAFKECYPDSKLSDLKNLDDWIATARGTCRSVDSTGKQSYGVCCSKSANVFATANVPVSSSSSVGFPHATLPQFQPFQGYPPQWYPSQSIPGYPSQNPQQHQGATPFQFPGIWFPYPFFPVLGGSPWAPPSIQTPTTTTTTPASTTTSKPAVEPVVAETTTSKPVPTTTTKPSSAWPTTKPTTTTTTSTPAPGKPVTEETGSSYEGKCGKGPSDVPFVDDKDRIVGGENALPGAWPFMVAMFNGKRQFCGGSILDSVHVLTAAHCIAHMSSWDVARLTVKMNLHRLKSDTEDVVIKRVRKVTRHKGFDARTLYNDIAILTLDSPIEFHENVGPVCLPSKTAAQSYSGEKAVVIGFGSLREGGSQPEVLQQVTVKIQSNDECKRNYGNDAPGGIVDHFLCAGAANQDSCSGDSGGPLLVNRCQVGIVSWGIGCGGRNFGIYTRVSSYREWIDKHTLLKN